MARAIRLARRGLYTTHPNPRVGCVVVRDGAVVGEGWHERAGLAHAEVNALAAAGDLARGATAYVTLEPCCHHGRTPPCTEALIAAGVRRVVAAAADPNAKVDGGGLARLRDAGIQVESGVLEERARALNPGYLSLMTRHRPWVRLKLAASLDGRTAMASGESQWITGPAARRDVQRLRAQASAVVTGTGTVLVDDPRLNVRLSAEELGISGEVRQPVRVILDSRSRTPATARILGGAGDVLVMVGADAPAAMVAALQARGAEIQRISGDGTGLDLRAVLSELARRDLGEIHLECGSVLAGAFLSARLVDEMIIYMAPHVMGDTALGMAHIRGLTAMKQRISLRWRDVRRVGEDLRLTAVPAEE